MEQVSVRDASIPALGLGTYPMSGSQCREAVERALELGYRHVDTAQGYDNESAVGAAVRASSVPRDDVFLVTKIHRSNLAHDDVLRSVDRSLDRLETGIDLLLIHVPSETVPIPETIRAMNELQDRRDVAHVGVSNFSVEQLAVARRASETPIVTNQVAYNAYKRRDELVAYCREHDVALSAYSPLAKGRLADDDTLAEIGERYDKTAAQVGLRWLVQQAAVLAVPKARRRSHQAENLDVFDFELTGDEMRRILELRGDLTDYVLDFFGL